MSNEKLGRTIGDDALDSGKSSDNETPGLKNKQIQRSKDNEAENKSTDSFYKLPRKAHPTSRSIVRENVYFNKKKVVYTAGRPSWFDRLGEPLMEPFCIGICGGSGSGKTTVANEIISYLDIPWVILLRLDSFYKSLTEEQCQKADRNEYDFDHPNAFDLDLAVSTLQRLKDGKRVDVPVYDFKTHQRTSYVQSMYGASVLIVEGIMTFNRKDLRDLLDLKIFLDTDSDVRLARRLSRDTTERDRTVKSILDQYMKYVKPAFDVFISPCTVYADVIIPRGVLNTVAIDMIAKHVQVRLRQRQAKDSRATLASSPILDDVLPPSLRLLPQTPQLTGMHTIIRNKETQADAFIFYSNRIARLVIEKALSLQTFATYEIRHAEMDSFVYMGKRRTGEKICGVSILRSGEVIEKPLRDVVKDCMIGKILIQTDWKQSSEPELHYLRVPKDIKKYKVILMDAQVATGAAAMMGIKIMLEHDVPETNITLVSLIMSAVGVNSIAYAFPNVTLVTSAVDPKVSDGYDILPGIGNFSDRYFGPPGLYNRIITSNHDSAFIVKANVNLKLTKMIVHPAFHRLGLRLSLSHTPSPIVDSDAQCFALIEAFKLLINEYHPPVDKSFAREIENVMKPCLSFVSGGKPLPPSMASLVKQLKYQLTHVLGTSNEDQATALIEWLDDFAEQKITLSTKAICLTLTEKFKSFAESPIILTYSYSSLVEEILLFAWKNGANFRVIIIDNLPNKRGQKLASSLISTGVNCQYVLVGAISHVMNSASLVLLGAEGFLANGAAVCPSGSSQICMVAKHQNIPVLVACQTYKFCEKVQTAAVEQGWPEDEVVPADFVTGVVTELRTLPCSSVPAVLRVKQLY